MLDIGCVVDGYTSDLTRTIFLGSPPKEFEDIYRIVGEAQALAIKAIKPGAVGKDIHNVARDYLARFGYGDKFPHALGHSLGLNIHERPSFAEWETGTIEVGNVITVEPGIYLPGRYGVRTEDLIVVTETGCDVLNRTDHALMVR
jgi:Xaa-Pro aminopeptidase